MTTFLLGFCVGIIIGVPAGGLVGQHIRVNWYEQNQVEKKKKKERK